MLRDELFPRAKELKELGWTNEAIADELGVNEKTIRRWFTADAKAPARRVRRLQVEGDRRAALESTVRLDMEIVKMPGPLQELAETAWSIRGLESIGVPPKEAPHLLGLLVVRIPAGDQPVPLTAVALVTEVRLFRDHPGIPADQANRLAAQYALAWAGNDDAQMEQIADEERFEPWRSKDHLNVFRGYLKQKVRLQEG